MSVAHLYVLLIINVVMIAINCWTLLRLLRLLKRTRKELTLFREVQ